MISSYQENLHNLQSWLSGCLRHGTSWDRNGVSAALEDWSVTLLKQREYISSTRLGQKHLQMNELINKFNNSSINE